MYLNIPTYGKDFIPFPELSWFDDDEDSSTCQKGNANLRVWRDGDNMPWWADCETPDFESKTWFYTKEQAQYWIEQEIDGWFR